MQRAQAVQHTLAATIKDGEPRDLLRRQGARLQGDHPPAEPLPSLGRNVAGDDMCGHADLTQLGAGRQPQLMLEQTTEGGASVGGLGHGADDA